MWRTAISSTVMMLFIGAQAIASDIRRVVTGPDANNNSTAMLDSRVKLAPVSNDLNLADLWITDSYPVGLSKVDTRDRSIGISPPENGTQFGVVEFPPLDPTNPAPALWHRTRTVDYVVVMSGEIDLMLEILGGASQNWRYRRSTSNKPRLDQSREGDLPTIIRADGFEAAVDWGTSAHGTNRTNGDVLWTSAVEG